MEKKIWSDEELEIIGRVFLEEPNTKNSTCEEAARRLREAGYGDVPVEKIKPQLGDFSAVHNGSKGRHHSKRVERIYGRLVGEVKRIMEGIGSHLFEVYGKEPILDYDVEVDVNSDNTISTSFGSLSDPTKVNLFVVPGLSTSTKSVSFIDFFLDLRIKTGKTDSEIYNPFRDPRGCQAFEGKKFNDITRGKQVTKRNLLAISILMELDYDTTVEFLAKANFGLSNRIKSDVIITHALKNKIYDVHEINETLYNYGCELLFFRG